MLQSRPQSSSMRLSREQSDSERCYSAGERLRLRDKGSRLFVVNLEVIERVRPNEARQIINRPNCGHHSGRLAPKRISASLD